MIVDDYDAPMKLDFNQKLQSGIYLIKLTEGNLTQNKLVVID